MKTHKDKQSFLKALEQMPNILHACKKVDISRQTIYRWIKEDRDFAFKIEESRQRGIENINDYAEGNVLSGIHRGEFNWTKMWLGSRHPAYRRPLIVLPPPPQENEMTSEEAIEEVMRWQEAWTGEKTIRDLDDAKKKKRKSGT